jgi:hypothetical protein
MAVGFVVFEMISSVRRRQLNAEILVDQRFRRIRREFIDGRSETDTDHCGLRQRTRTLGIV